MMIGPSLALPAVRRSGGLVFFAPANGTTWTLSSLGIGDAGVGTYLWRGTFASLGTGAIQVAFVLDDGDTSDAYGFRNPAAGSAGQVFLTIAAATTSVSGGALTAATTMRFGVSIAGDGSAVASLNGAATVSVTGGPTSGLTTLRAGNSAAGTQALSGSTAVLRALPGLVLSAADLQAEVSAV